MKTFISNIAAAGLLAGCVSLPPSTEQLAALPVVVYPQQPAQKDYIYKFPAGKPIPFEIRVDGSAIGLPVKQTLTTTLARDIYLHDRWASEDGQHWLAADELIKANLNVVLPTYAAPTDSFMHLSLHRHRMP